MTALSSFRAKYLQSQLDKDILPWTAASCISTHQETTRLKRVLDRCQDPLCHLQPQQFLHVQPQDKEIKPCIHKCNESLLVGLFCGALITVQKLERAQPEVLSGLGSG